MDFDWTISITTIIAVAGIASTGLVAWVTTINRGHRRYRRYDRGDNATHKMLAERVEGIRAKSGQELADFKLEVAKN
jgi:hypothetical protein